MRDAPAGKVLFAADDSVSYDWATHTRTLKGGVQEPFAKVLKAARRFAVCVDGKQAVEGRNIGPAFAALMCPVIVVPDGKDDGTVTIERGSPELLKSDPEKRDVKELKTALEMAGKLKADK